jgi:hypothetical protein
MDALSFPAFDKYNDMLVDLNEGSLKIDKMLDETKVRSSGFNYSCF